jgi:hypothetical protein
MPPRLAVDDSPHFLRIFRKLAPCGSLWTSGSGRLGRRPSPLSPP